MGKTKFRVFFEGEKGGAWVGKDWKKRERGI